MGQSGALGCITPAQMPKGMAAARQGSHWHLSSDLEHRDTVALQKNWNIRNHLTGASIVPQEQVGTRSRGHSTLSSLQCVAPVDSWGGFNVQINHYNFELS